MPDDEVARDTERRSDEDPLPQDQRICPRCGAAIQPVPVLYGYPTHEAFEAAERGEIRLGGCVVGDESPDYACPTCDGFLPWVRLDRS